MLVHGEINEMFQHLVPYPIGDSSAEPAGDKFFAEAGPFLGGYRKQIACDDQGYGCHGHIGFRPVDKSAQKPGHQDLQACICQYDGAQKKHRSFVVF